MARTHKKLVPDYANSDALRGLPNNFTTVHSRYPSVPSAKSGAVAAQTEPTGDVDAVQAALRALQPSPSAIENWNTVLAEIAAAKPK